MHGQYGDLCLFAVNENFDNYGAVGITKHHSYDVSPPLVGKYEEHETELDQNVVVAAVSEVDRRRLNASIVEHHKMEIVLAHAWSEIGNNDQNQPQNGHVHYDSLDHR